MSPSGFEIRFKTLDAAEQGSRLPGMNAGSFHFGSRLCKRQVIHYMVHTLTLGFCLMANGNPRLLSAISTAYIASEQLAVTISPTEAEIVGDFTFRIPGGFPKGKGVLPGVFCRRSRVVSRDKRGKRKRRRILASAPAHTIPATAILLEGNGKRGSRLGYKHLRDYSESGAGMRFGGYLRQGATQG